jgi:hypothetical protein
MKVQEKKRKEKKRKIAMFPKWFTKGERLYKRSSHPPFIIHYIHTRAQLDLIVWLVFLLGSGFLTLQYMWCKYTLSFIPTLSSTYSHH